MMIILKQSGKINKNFEINIAMRIRKPLNTQLTNQEYSSLGITLRMISSYKLDLRLLTSLVTLD